jgi:hypothetical protein
VQARRDDHPELRAGVDIDVRVDAALADEPELRQSAEEWRGDLGALANEHERFGVAQSLGERVDVLDVIVPDLDVVPRQVREAVERPQRVLVVVEDGDLHRGRPSARRRLAVLAQMLRPGGGNRDERAASRRTTTRDEASLAQAPQHVVFVPESFWKR